MTFNWTEDYGLVRHILTAAKCYRRMKNDTAPPIERFSVGPTGGVRFIIADEGGCAAAVFLLDVRKTEIGEAEIHFCILPEWWGHGASIGLQFMEWVWKNTSLDRLIGPVPAYNMLAFQTAVAAGFYLSHRSDPCVRKDGELYSILRTEIMRPVHVANLTAGA